MAIIKGETIKLTATFTDADGNAASPTMPVTISVRDSGGSVDPNEDTVSEGDTGVFEYSYTTTKIGVHKYRFKSADGAKEKGNFYVDSDITD